MASHLELVYLHYISKKEFCILGGPFRHALVTLQAMRRTAIIRFRHAPVTLQAMRRAAIITEFRGKNQKPLFEELGQTSQDSWVSDQNPTLCWDVCPNSPKSGKSILSFGVCFAVKIVSDKIKKIQKATFRRIRTNVPGFLVFRSKSDALLGRLS